MPKSTKYIVVIVTILIVIAAMGIVWKRSQDLTTMSKPATRAIPVEIATTKDGRISVTAHYLGKVDSGVVVELSSRITANLMDVKKREGDKVTVGEVVVVLDNLALANKTRAIEADLRAAQSALAAAESFHQTQQASFERNRRLYEQSAIAQEAYEQSRSAADNAGSQLSAARERIHTLEENREASIVEQGYARLVSPINGIVSKRAAEPGEVAVPGKSLLSLQAEDKGYKVTVQVTQGEVRKVGPGTEVILTHSGHKLNAVVSKVYPALNQASLATVEIQVPSLPFELPAGSAVGVDIVLNQVEGIVVPVESLVQNSKGSFVVVIDDNDSACQTPVEVLGRNAEVAAIRGIAPNTKVALGQENLLMQLTTGKKVLISRNRSEGI